MENNEGMVGEGRKKKKGENFRLTGISVHVCIQRKNSEDYIII